MVRTLGNLCIVIFPAELLNESSVSVILVYLFYKDWLLISYNRKNFVFQCWWKCEICMNHNKYGKWVKAEWLIMSLIKRKYDSSETGKWRWIVGAVLRRNLRDIKFQNSFFFLIVRRQGLEDVLLQAVPSSAREKFQLSWQLRGLVMGVIGCKVCDFPIEELLVLLTLIRVFFFWTFFTWKFLFIFRAVESHTL
jgi:hypothetical protein